MVSNKFVIIIGLMVLCAFFVMPVMGAYTIDNTTVPGQTIIKFTSTDTWVAPSLVSSVWTTIVGGGGNFGTHGGGGGGEVINTTTSITPGNSYTITIGTLNQNSSFNNLISRHGNPPTDVGQWYGGTSGNGNVGGSGYPYNHGAGGGGGGSGGIGGNAPNDYTSGAAGVGTLSYISGNGLYLGIGGTGGHGVGSVNPTVGNGGNGYGVIYIRYMDPIYTSFTQNISGDYRNTYPDTSRSFTVQFNDTTTGTTPTSWMWYFTNRSGNNTQTTFSTSQNATYTFGVGNWSIRLNATGSGYTNTTTADTKWINVSQPLPVASFSVNNTAGAYPLSIQFTDTSYSGVAYNYSFGDNGSWSTYQNPVYTFNGKGLFNVSLKTYNIYGEYNITPTTTQINVQDPATPTWSSNTYASSDTGTVNYIIDNKYWSPSTYTYSMNIYDVSAILKSSQALTLQNGSKSFVFDTTNYPVGYYWAYVTRTRILPGETAVVLGSAQTQVVGYVRLTGYVLDAENGTKINGNVSIVQGSTVKNQIATGGAYDTNPTAFSSGLPIYYNVTLSGYQQYILSYTPLTAKTIPVNITLMRNAPTYVGASIGGRIYNPPYNLPISGATVTVRNVANAELYTNVTNNAGYYRVDNLVPGRVYDIYSTKSGYQISPTIQRTAV